MEKTNWTIIAGIVAVLVVFLAIWMSRNTKVGNSITTITGSGNSSNNITNQNQYTTKNTNFTTNISDILNGGLNDMENIGNTKTNQE